MHLPTNVSSDDAMIRSASPAGTFALPTQRSHRLGVSCCMALLETRQQHPLHQWPGSAGHQPVVSAWRHSQVREQRHRIDRKSTFVGRHDHRANDAAQLRLQQVVLGCIVRVEGGAPHAGLARDVGDANALVSPAMQHRHERGIDLLARAQDALIDRICDIFRDVFRFVSGNRHAFFGLAVQSLALFGTRLVPRWSPMLVTGGCMLFLLFWDLDNWMLIGAVLMLVGLLPVRAGLSSRHGANARESHEVP